VPSDRVPLRQLVRFRALGALLGLISVEGRHDQANLVAHGSVTSTELQGNRDQAHAGVGRLPGAELRRQRSHVPIVSGTADYLANTPCAHLLGAVKALQRAAALDNALTIVAA
jgi:hypothetical protein